MTEAEKANKNVTDPADDIEALRNAVLCLAAAVAEKCMSCRGGLDQAICCDDESCSLNPYARGLFKIEESE